MTEIREILALKVKPMVKHTDLSSIMLNVATTLLPVETRHRRITELLVVLWTFSMADLFFTLWAHRFTPFIELNPFAGALLGQNMVLSVVLYKVTLMLFATSLFWRARHSPRTEFALWGLVMVYGLLMIRWSNYTLEASTSIATAGWFHQFNGL